MKKWLKKVKKQIKKKNCFLYHTFLRQKQWEICGKNILVTYNILAAWKVSLYRPKKNSVFAHISHSACSIYYGAMHWNHV